MAMDTITMFKEAAKQLQKEACYLALDHARKCNDEDENLQKLIGDFNLARMDLNTELAKGDEKDSEKVTAINVKVNNLYTEIMANESMVAYNESKEELEAIVSHVNAILSTAVNGGDPDSVEQPQSGCSGSCSSCSGCH